MKFIAFAVAVATLLGATTADKVVGQMENVDQGAQKSEPRRLRKRALHGRRTVFDNTSPSVDSSEEAEDLALQILYGAPPGTLHKNGLFSSSTSRSGKSTSRSGN